MSWKTGSQLPYINEYSWRERLVWRAVEEVERVVSHEKFKFWFQCHMLHAARQQGSKACPAGRQATIFVIAIVDGVCRAGFRATSSAKLNTGERQCRRGKILALDKRQRQLRQRDSGLGPGKPNPRPGTDPDKKGAALSLSVSVQPSSASMIDFMAKLISISKCLCSFFLAPFPFFLLLCLLLRVLVAWGFAGWQELWHYPYLERSIADTEGRGEVTASACRLIAQSA